MIFPAALPLLLGFFLFLLVVLVFVVELRVLGYAYRKIGVPARAMFAVMLLSLVGSHVNIPLWAIHVERVLSSPEITVFGRTYVAPPVQQEGATIVAVNVGGALLPVLLSLYLFLRSATPGRMLLGIAVPMFIPPLAAAAVSLLLAFRGAPPVAYVSGSMGALIGADLLNLYRLGELGAPVVSIGGAGTFDGVFLTGLVAGLLA